MKKEHSGEQQWMKCKLDNESVGCNKLGQSCQTSLTTVTDISEGNKYSF